MIRLTSRQHSRLALAYLRNAAAPQLTLPEKRELQDKAKRHEALAARAELERHPQ